ncbi:MAG: translation initiation factor IF-2 [Candidatus Pacearchaeota archaeon]
MEIKKIRQPIITVCGHVDHGKTSILDRIRQSSVHEEEAGGITQKISFSLYPIEEIKKSCPLIERYKIKLKIPGFLFIDTPGHAAFTNLRKRGGSLSDIAILVIDINEGIKPQTSEVIQILKKNKTPFIIALNKIDNIHGWKYFQKEEEAKKRVELQAKDTKSDFNEKYLTIIGSLQNYGFDSDLFYNIDDFTKKVSLIPCSAKTGEGISELIMVLCGLSQKYLSERLTLGGEPKGIILEVKKEKENQYLESILYDGELTKKDHIAIANIDGQPIITKIRILEEILPLSFKFVPKDKISAATGFRMQIVEKAEVLPGMPFVIYKNNKEEIERLFKQEISESIKIDNRGIIVKADSLGSLEALITILKQEGISVLRAGIGKINKRDILDAKANIEINELDAIIVGFNVKIEDEAAPLLKQEKGIKIITDEVIYRLIDNLKEFRIEKKNEIEKRKLLEISPLAKISILHQYVFRNTNPAIFGVRVEAGKITQKMSIIDENNEKIGSIKSIQSEKKPINEAVEGQEVAISIYGINFERRMKDVKVAYSDITEQQYKNLIKNKDILSQSEIKVLGEILEIKRKENINWGYR